MATQPGSVRMHQDGPTITFQVIGWGKMNQSMPVRRIAEAQLAEGTTMLRVDLRHCTYIDSTFLGTLLYLKRLAQRKHKSQLVLVAPSAECSRLFKQMGVEDCLPAVACEEPDVSAWTELACAPEDVDTFNRNVVEAHQELANLGGPAGKTFEAVARCLSKDHEGR